MCSEVQSAETGMSTGAVPTVDSRLTGLLTPAMPPTPKVSVPLIVPERLKARLAALNAKRPIPLEENETFHVTADSAYITANSVSEAGTSDPAHVTIVGPSETLTIGVAPPPTGDESLPQLFDNWSFSLSWLPFLAGAKDDPEPPPLITYEVAVTGSSATIAGYKHASSQQLQGLGLNVFCIARAGGASILSTIASCLPALAGGTDAFKDALLHALAPGGIDLVEKLMKCI